MNNSNYTFSFKSEIQEKVSKLIKNLNCIKATHQYVIPIKILKENFFSYTSCHNFNDSLFSKVFPNGLQKADITPSSKKTKKFSKIITNLLAFCQVSQKSMNFVHTFK